MPRGMHPSDEREWGEGALLFAIHKPTTLEQEGPRAAAAARQCGVYPARCWMEDGRAKSGESLEVVNAREVEGKRTARLL